MVTIPVEKFVGALLTEPAFELVAALDGVIVLAVVRRTTEFFVILLYTPVRVEDLDFMALVLFVLGAVVLVGAFSPRVPAAESFVALSLHFLGVLPPVDSTLGQVG